MPEHDGRPPIRPLYLAEALIAWVNETDELYVENWSKKSGGRSRFEHLDQTLADFRCDDHPLVGELNRVRPTKKGIWKMHCPGLRVYGWAPDLHSFVAVTAAFSEDAHGRDSVTDKMVKEVLDFARKYELNNTIQYGARNELFRKKDG